MLSSSTLDYLILQETIPHMIPNPNEKDRREIKRGDNIPTDRSFLRANRVNGSVERMNPAILKIKR